MAILFSNEFRIKKSVIIQSGVFDVLLDEDSHFFINIKRLEATQIPEFSNSYIKINEYFRKIGLLLKVANIGDKNYRTAIKLFNFPEVNGINLGFSSGSRGAGFGPQLRDQIIKDAYEIIKSGSEQPEIFHLTSLFEENVGPDRLSDMIARLVYDDIVNYSKRIYQELGIVEEHYTEYRFENGIPRNPYKNAPLLLLPVDVLHELPIARDWDDIDRVCRENEAIRNEINALVSGEWRKMAASAKKQYLRDWIFKNPDRLRRVVESYRNSSVESFNVFTDINYLVEYLRNDLSFTSEVQESSIKAARCVINSYKEWVEYHRGSLVLADAKSRNAEKAVQRTLHATALMYCKTNNWDISPEEDGGRGPVDFKISRGNDKTVVEIKLTSNAECVHGLEIQIEEYAVAENTENKIFVLVDNGVNSDRVTAVLAKHREMLERGKKPADAIIIDAKPKESASKYRPDK